MSERSGPDIHSPRQGSANLTRSLRVGWGGGMLLLLVSTSDFDLDDDDDLEDLEELEDTVVSPSFVEEFNAVSPPRRNGTCAVAEATPKFK